MRDLCMHAEGRRGADGGYAAKPDRSARTLRPLWRSDRPASWKVFMRQMQGADRPSLSL